MMDASNTDITIKVATTKTRLRNFSFLTVRGKSKKSCAGLFRHYQTKLTSCVTHLERGRYYQE